MHDTMTMMVNPSGQLALMAQVARIGFEAQAVIAMRLAGLMGLSRQAPDEPLRMFTEKHEAACESMQAVLLTTSRGASPQRVMAAALMPYGARTKANSSRLFGKE